MMTSQGVSTLHIITRVFKKIPVPMTLPTTIETDAKTPRPRTSVTGLFDGSDMRVLVRHTYSRVRCLRLPHFDLPDFVVEQVFVRVASADDVRTTVFANQDDRGERATVVGEHLRDCV